MSPRTRHWLHGLGAAVIGGSCSAAVSGLTSMGFSPDKFNLTSLAGVGHLLGMMGVNLVFNGILSAFFYLKQSPLPPESTGNTEIFEKSQV